MFMCKKVSEGVLVWVGVGWSLLPKGFGGAVNSTLDVHLHRYDELVFL
jgi:hypothetical protein